VTESGAVAWISHPHVPQALPMPNLIGLPPFEDGSPRSIAPGKGQHSEAILTEHGFSKQAITELTAQGIVALAPPPS
jgi:crotonobetainyl-CoA:carnitine CoA-transferase CaiB-like acyl-CoA transferase